MSTLIEHSVLGVLRSGWSVQLNEFAVAGAWSARGDRLFVVDAAGGCYALDARSGDPAWQQEGAHALSCNAIAANPRVSVLATAGQDRRLRVWHIDTGTLMHDIELRSCMVDSLVWSPTGKFLAVADGRHVRVWSSDLQWAWESDAQSSTVAAVCWTGAEELAACAYEQVTVWQLPDGAVVNSYRWRSAFVSLTTNRDGSVIAAGAQDKTVHFWRRPSGEDSMMSGYDQKPDALTFDARGDFLATGGGSDITLWTFRDGGPEGTRPLSLSLHTATISTLAFAPRSAHLVSGGRDGGIIVWDVQSPDAENGQPVGGAAVRARVAQVLWRPDGQALAALDSEGGVTAFRARC